MKQLFLILVISFLVLNFSCKNENEVNIKIVETTDVHGAIFSYDFINDSKKDGSLSQVMTYLKEQRTIADHEIILVDNGDIMQGQPTVYYSNFIDTVDQHICSKVMNYMNYDVFTIGNHDIETGHSVYDKVVKEFNFPTLAANAVTNSTGKPYFKPYEVIERKGVKIAFLGLVTPGIPNWLPENLFEGMHFEDMIKTAEYWMPIIQKKEKPDLIVGLFHSGFDYAYGGATDTEENNENATVLVAKQVKGFDLILIGHDHQKHNEWIVNNYGDSVLILDPRSSAKNLAVATIQFKKNGRKYDKKIQGEIIDVSNYEADQEFDREFAENFKQVQSYVNQSLGTFTKTIYSEESLFGPSEFTDLINFIQLELTDADVSFTAPLSRDAVIEQGNIFVRDLFKLYRFENMLYTMTLSGQEIKDYLEFNYENWFDSMNSGHLIRFKKDLDGKLNLNEKGFPTGYVNYYNYDVAAGINYTVDLSAKSGNRITISSLSDNSPFDLSKEYKVAINSYRGNGGGGHLIDGAKISKSELSKRMINSTEKDLRYYIMQWIIENKTIDPVKLNNWEVVPNTYYEKTKQKDALLYLGRKD